MNRSPAADRTIPLIPGEPGPLPQHSSATVEHYTPIEIIEAARLTMGGIDLDPATTERVNELRVRAVNIYTKETDGLAGPWWGRVWLNPPGGRVGNRSSAAVWWSKLANEYAAGRVKQAVFMGFSIELLATTQSAAIWPGNVPFCIPRKRIQFLREDSPGVFEPGESPTHSNVVIYLPPRNEWETASSRFVDAFSDMGKCRI